MKQKQNQNLNVGVFVTVIIIITGYILYYESARHQPLIPSAVRPSQYSAFKLRNGQSHNQDKNYSSHIRKSFSRPRRVRRSGLYDPEYKEGDPIITLPLTDRYFMYKRKMDWNSAKDQCEEDDRDLARLIKRSDAQALVDALHRVSHFSRAYDWKEKQVELGLDRNYWIGLFDLGHEGKWEWVDNGGFLTYNDFWTVGQPDHVHPNGTPASNRIQHCGGLWNPWFHKDTRTHPEKHTLDDKECTHELYFICEEDSGTTSDPKNPGETKKALGANVRKLSSSTEKLSAAKVTSAKVTAATAKRTEATTGTTKPGKTLPPCQKQNCKNTHDAPKTKMEGNKRVKICNSTGHVKCRPKTPCERDECVHYLTYKVMKDECPTLYKCETYFCKDEPEYLELIEKKIKDKCTQK